MNYILSTVVGLIIGSIPTAYLLLKKYNGIDITQNGSGNVGAMNSFQITNSKLVGFAVLVIDLAKGAIVVLIAKELIADRFDVIMTGFIAAVWGHCFSFYIKFKGGRGLATAAGGSLLVSPPIFALWILLWLISYLFRKSIHFSNFAATALVMALSFSSVNFLVKYTYPAPDSNLQFSIMTSLLLLIILIKHIGPVKTYFSQKIRKDENESV